MLTRRSRKARRQLIEKQQKNQMIKNRAKTAVGAAAVLSSISASTVLPSFTNEARAFEVGMSRAQYIEHLASYAVPIARQNGLWASVMIAQALLESNFGNSGLSSSPHHNLFGIKGAFQGRSVTMPTKEFLNGEWVTVNAAFRSYPSFAESFQDYANVIRNTSFGAGPFYIGAWKSNSRSFEDATAWLQGRYATDPNYAASLNNMIRMHNLTRFDTTEGVGTGSIPVNNIPNTSAPSAPANNVSTPSTANGKTYKIVAGDTLSAIAARFGTTVANLKSWNNLKSDLIYIGQTIQVGAATSANNTVNTPSASNNASTSNAKTYTVVAGDTLSAIAARNGTTVANLKSWNNLSSDLIFIGQNLKVGAGTTSPTTPPPTNMNNVTSTPANNQKTYTVVSGDTLSAIAARFSTSVSNLKSWNNLTSDLILIGQSLKVGAATGTTAPPVNTVNVSNNNQTGTQQTYTIVSGDTLSAISARFNTSVANLKSWNNLSSDMIYVGQKLAIKAGAPAPNQASSTSVSSAPNTNTQQAKTYTVVAEDNLTKIAQKFNTSVSTLKSWNNLNSDLIRIGQALKVGDAPVTTPSSNQSANQASDSSYQVVSGDSLWGISQRFGTSVAAIKQLNNLSSDTIRIGQNLRVK